MPPSAPASLTVRPYQSGDAPAIGALITAIQQDEFQMEHRLLPMRNSKLRS